MRRRAAALVAPAKTSLVVGTVLCVVNGSFVPPNAGRIALNYAVPLLVAAWSRASLARELARRKTSSTDH